MKRSIIAGILFFISTCLIIISNLTDIKFLNFLATFFGYQVFLLYCREKRNQTIALIAHKTVLCAKLSGIVAISKFEEIWK